MLIMLLKVYLVPLTDAPTSDFITHLDVGPLILQKGQIHMQIITRADNYTKKVHKHNKI